MTRPAQDRGARMHHPRGTDGKTRAEGGLPIARRRWIEVTDHRPAAQQGVPNSVRIICRVCGAVPMSRSVIGRWTLDDDRKGYLCRVCHRKASAS